MRVYGIDFTSTPRSSKPIVCAAGWIEQEKLHIESITCWVDFSQFEEWTHSKGPWIAGCDFPFGQPKRLVKQLNWPTCWGEYVQYVGKQSRETFVKNLRTYSESQPTGMKHLFRWTDRVASACSPMMIFGVPVAKMFYEGATRLNASKVNIVPCRPTNDSRTVIETYPALAVRGLVGRTPYKSSRKTQDTEKKKAIRKRILNHILSTGRLTNHYGITAVMNTSLRRSVENDHCGDHLDSVLSSVQAAWAFRYGLKKAIPEQADSDEGWIVDPSTITMSTTKL